MSAIAVIFRRDGGAVDTADLDRMLAAGSHRAVDGQNVYADGSVALAHQHFWITPEERGEIQPLVDNEAGLVITCDARLDNRDDLYRSLGVDRSQILSDAELILRAYKKWAQACADRLLGDFAFVIWDKDKQALYVARDGLGVRDLCFHETTDVFIAASEPKQIAAHPCVDRRINETKVGEYLVGRWTDQASTFYQNVSFWSPGQDGTVTRRNTTRRTFWQIDTGRTLRFRDEGEYASAFVELLTRSARNHSRVAGDMGVSLSGGPDSATLASLYADILPRPVKSFSYVFDRYPSCDERNYIQAVVDRLDLDATLINGDELWPLSQFETWPVYADFAGQDPYVRLPMAVIDRAAASGCRVVFNGHYSDVLFAGGQAWSVELLGELRIMEFLRLMRLSQNKYLSLKRLARQSAAVVVPSSVRKRLRRWVPGQSSVLLERLSREFIERTALRDRIQQTTAGPRAQNTRTIRAAHLTNALEPQGDSAFRALSNRRGIEYIDPYKDRQLVDFIMAVPAYILGRPPYAKWLLRQAVNTRVPDEVLFRADKTSLYALFQAGLARHAREHVLDLMDESLAVRAGIIDHGWLQARRDQLRQRRDQFEPDHAFWQVLCLELWLRRYWN